MPTRDLKKNLQSSQKKLQDRLDKITSREFRDAYTRQLDETTAILTRLLAVDPAELTSAQRAQLLRNSNILTALNERVAIFTGQTRESVETIAKAALDASYATSGWAVNQYVGINMVFGGVNDRAVAAAVGISGDFEALAGFMPRAEVLRHKKILDTALDVNYSGDLRKWISRAVSDGIIRGEGVPKIKKRLQDALDMGRKSAEVIARTEGLRSLSLGSQIAYDEAADQGVNLRQVWDATLDSRTRPDHVVMDGRAQNPETGLFENTPWGSSTPGPHRTGIPGQDINCRCTVTPEVEGFAPEVRRVRGEGLVPYQTAEDWIREQGLTTNKYGQRYSFIPKTNISKGIISTKSNTVPAANVFRPAKDTREAILRLSRYADRVILPDANLEAMNSILRGTEDVLGKYGVRVNEIGYQIKKSKSWGRAGYSGSHTYIRFQKTFLNNPVKANEKAVRVFNQNKKYSENLNNDIMNRPNISSSMREYTIEKSRILSQTERWNVGNDLNDPIYSTAIHEAFHQVQQQKKIRWPSELKNVDRADWFKVSEYGASNQAELFAETGVAVTRGVEIPESISRLFNEMIKDIE